MVTLTAFALARFDLADVPVRAGGLMSAVLIAVVIQVSLGAALIYRGQYRYGSRDEIVTLAMIGALIAIALTIYTVLLPSRPIPLSVALFSFTGAVGLMAAVRFFALRQGSNQTRKSNGPRTLILGAGEGGALAIEMMQTDRNNHYVPVALLDDDPHKRFLRIGGVRVMGTLDDLAKVAERTNADTALLAIPSASSEVVLRASRVAREAGLQFRTMPSTSALMTVAPEEARREHRLTTQAMFRKVGLEDLIGRNPVDTDLQAISAYLDGKVVLVTGAGGSIGSQLAREISQFAPRRLVLTDRDESGLHTTQLSIEGSALLDSEDVVLCDLRVPGMVDELIGTIRPDVVFHAAALKHLPLLERFPYEALSANVHVTYDLARACKRHDVARFVHISTDKAADPISVLGYSKRAAERLVAGVANGSGKHYISVRFGNVLGSRGSALRTWSAQVATNRPLTITDPGMYRYFMSVNEACQLVLQAATIGGPGQALVLDMGDAVHVETIARRYAELNGAVNVDVVYTGVRPGEKLRESRLGAAETDERPHHELITHVQVPPLQPRQLTDLAELRSRAGLLPAEDVLAWLKRVGTET
ncbi:polysaccharide biosynthesis protein [Pseudactinotalea sp. Z1739]|uniref:polysaccharide biosynthesis protein n=1 Tax=Pseudactinotalea sp. Z1739 TaxID=3413028 RepID=UPI003C7A03A7